MWRYIEGYRWPYRINEEAQIERQHDDGTWTPLKPYIKWVYKQQSGGKLYIAMQTPDKKRKEVTVKGLMIDAFLGGRKKGVMYGFRNESFQDCSLRNLYRITQKDINDRVGHQRRKPVVKVDRKGNVVEFYSSVREAAKKNYASPKYIQNRCKRRVKDRYDADGYTYRYER